MSTNLIKAYIDDTIVAAEAAMQGVKVGEEEVSGLIFGDDFVGVSDTPERLHKQVDKATENTRNEV